MAALQDAKYGLQLSINTDMLVELNCTKQANYQNQKRQILNQYGNAVIFHSGSCSCNNLETYNSGSGSNIETPAGVDSGTPVCVHLW